MSCVLPCAKYRTHALQQSEATARRLRPVLERAEFHAPTPAVIVYEPVEHHHLTEPGYLPGCRYEWAARITAGSAQQVGCIRRGTMRMRKFDRKIGGHSKQTYSRKQVREKAHGGTLLVSGMASLMGGSDKRCDIGHKMSRCFEPAPR
jgi:hypothetical protein